MGYALKRGDVCWYAFAHPNKRRPVLILTRDSALPVLNSVTVAPISTTIRSIPSEVLLTSADGLPEICAANLDHIQTVPRANVSAPIARLSRPKMQAVAVAAQFALALLEP